MVIDSFKALHAFADNYGEFRRFLHELAGRLSAFPAASLWVGEYEDAEVGSLPEFAVADAIVELAADRVGQREIRYPAGPEAARQRLPGRPACLPAQPPAACTCSPGWPTSRTRRATSWATTRVSSGIPALDEMLGDGYWPGSSTLIAGPSGSGKTLMGLHFILTAARQGEPGVIATLQENPTQLQRMLRGLRAGR